jgi:hypothetical protein
MQIIFGFALTLSVLALIIGTFRPGAIIRWGREEEKNIGKVATFCWPVIFITTCVYANFTGDLVVGITMAIVFMMIWALLLFVVGLFSPKAIIWWGQSKTRKNSSIFSLTAFALSLVILVIFSSSSSKLANLDKSRIDEIAQKDAADKKIKDEQDAKIAATEKEDAVKKAAKNAEAKIKRAQLNGQIKETMDAFNDIESKSDFKALYSGVQVSVGSSGEYHLQIDVTDYWNGVSKDVKLTYINHVITIWGGMCQARKIPFNLEKLEITFVHNMSGRTVATWNSVFGPSIKD